MIGWTPLSGHNNLNWLLVAQKCEQELCITANASANYKYNKVFASLGSIIVALRPFKLRYSSLNCPYQLLAIESPFRPLSGTE